MAGYDLEVDGPRAVPLEIQMQVCVKPDYFRADVKAALSELFSSRVLADGRRGLFHPDHFTFGQTVFLSPLYAAAQAVDGVASVHVTVFQRLGRRMRSHFWTASWRWVGSRSRCSTTTRTFPIAGATG